MIAIIDYGLGNIRAFLNIFKTLNIHAIAANEPQQLISAEKLVLPGVGSFDHAMLRLNNSGMREIIDELVLEKKIPVLGICVGMQMLAKSSTEGVSPGLDWIDAKVERFDASTFTHPSCIPHMGWNTILPKGKEKILSDLDVASAKFYFLHSYFFKCNNPDDSVAVTDYNGLFTSIVKHENIFGFQFHPEKSHKWGMKLLENFSKL